MKKIIYISGLYSNGDTIKNIQLAKTYAIKFWNMGAAVICPHMNTAFFEQEEKVTATYDDFIAGDLAIIERVDAVFALPNWEKSEGAKKEVFFAEELLIPIFEYVKEVKQFLKNPKFAKCAITGRYREDLAYMHEIPMCKEYRSIIKHIVAQELRDINKNFVLVPRLSDKKQRKKR